MSLLSLVQRASVRVGIASPSAAIGSGDVTYEQLAELANEEGEELARAFDWKALNRPLTITGDGVTTIWALPSDFERWVIPKPLWEASRPMFPLKGPITNSQMLELQASTSNPAFPVWRMVETEIEIYPALALNQVINGEYFSLNWVTSSDGTAEHTYYTTDSDIAILDERLIRLGVIWRWKRAKGLDYAEEFRTYQVEKAKREGSDGGKDTVSASRNTDWRDARRNAVSVTGP